MATAKKINPHAQAPELIRQIQDELLWTQDDLCGFLRITQQAVSNYRAGYVMREQYEVIKRLEYILAKKLRPPLSINTEEVVNDAIADVETFSGDGHEGKAKTKTASVSPISQGRTKGGSKHGKKQS